VLGKAVLPLHLHSSVHHLVLLRFTMRTIVQLALLCGLVSVSSATRVTPTVDAAFGRILLQAPNCARIANCEQCYNARNDDAVTVLLCRVCQTGYRPTVDAAACGKWLQTSSAALASRLIDYLCLQTYLAHPGIPLWLVLCPPRRPVSCTASACAHVNAEYQYMPCFRLTGYFLFLCRVCTGLCKERGDL
jgi:hypothetical protein